MRYSHPPELRPIVFLDGSIYAWSIKRFLIFFGALLLSVIMAISVVITYRITATYLEQAYSRNAQFRSMAQAHDINNLLLAAKHELKYLANGSLTPKDVLAYLERKSAEERNWYCEFAFEGETAEDRFVIINNDSEVMQVPLAQVMATQYSIFANTWQMEGKPENFVYISDPLEVMYPAMPGRSNMSTVNLHVIRLSTAVYGANKEYRGRVTLSINLLRIRDILTLHNSKKSPLSLEPQPHEAKISFFFDTSGWLLFQSDTTENGSDLLSVDLLRVDLRGDVSRPGFSSAFRPSVENDIYWTMVSAVQNGQNGQFMVSRTFFPASSSSQAQYLSYAPILFQEDAETTRIIGGIGCLDASMVAMTATWHTAATLTVLLCVGVICAALVMYLVSRNICKQLAQLSHAVETRVNGEDNSPLTLFPIFKEINSFQRAINILLVQLQIARSDSLRHEGIHEDDRMRQPIDMNKEIQKTPGLDPQMLARPFHSIIGAGPATSELCQQIQKTAKVLADVLVIGETGTGKELAAEAIHLTSYRAQGPYISINCGALDENLLMDALFGHMKGAFSDAREDRQGAFLAASGGTLHLDEIGNASLKVQQALLRALSVRRIRPLGSDKDIAFDVRIIAATNVDLQQLVLTGQFREDLYYRLAVITVKTPALRQRKEDIPLLVRYFLSQYPDPTTHEPRVMSRGALEKLMHYDWPGNVRELKHCITRALTFADGDILLAEHIVFVTHTTKNSKKGANFVLETAESNSVALLSPEEQAAAMESSDLLFQLNSRQRQVWPLILSQGRISRTEYQDAVGHGISARTAQYDLQDLVAKGVLKKIGRGPSSQYQLSQEWQEHF